MESLKNKKDAYRTNVLMTSNQEKPLNNIKFTSSIVKNFLLNLPEKGCQKGFSKTELSNIILSFLNEEKIQSILQCEQWPLINKNYSSNMYSSICAEKHKLKIRVCWTFGAR